MQSGVQVAIPPLIWLKFELPKIDAHSLRYADRRLVAHPQAVRQFVSNRRPLAGSAFFLSFQAALMLSPFKHSLSRLTAAVRRRLRNNADRKRAEKALRASEERFRAFMDHSPAAAWITDTDGRIIYLSASYRRMLLLPAGELIGRTASDLYPPEIARVYLDNIRAVARSGEVLRAFEPVIRADGTTGEGLVYKFPLGDADGKTLVGGVAIDITDQTRAEEALRLRDRAISAATQGILITEPAQPENRIIYASPGFERLTGYSADEVIGWNCRFLQGSQTDPAAVARLRQAIRDEEPCTVELLNYKKDGTPFWNELSVSPVMNADGKLTHFVGVQVDVTGRRRLEEQFRQAQKMEAIGQLASGVAHDFNNLLTVINGYCDFLLERIAPNDPFREPLDEIQKAGERGAELTRQLLTISRKQVLSPRIIDLNAVVSGTENMLRRVIGGNVQIATLLESELWSVRADSGQIEQVLLNLAVNARDAMPAGGKLTIETQNVAWEEVVGDSVDELSPGYYVLLAVSDTGCGMLAEVKARIFEPFFTTKEPGKGTGLGLATVYGIVKQSGGHIVVASEVGQGTTVSIFVPRYESPS